MKIGETVNYKYYNDGNMYQGVIVSVEPGFVFVDNPPNNGSDKYIKIGIEETRLGFPFIARRVHRKER